MGARNPGGDFGGFTPRFYVRFSLRRLALSFALFTLAAILAAGATKGGLPWCG